MFSALAPDGSPVDGFAFEGNAVSWTGDEPVEAGIRYKLGLPSGEPDWLVPGVFYGENRVESCTRPRFTLDRVDVARMESNAWSFRADRCSTPAVFCGDRGLITQETSPLGQSGVGFVWRGGRPVVWVDWPYREEPLRYDGSGRPAPPDVRTYRWRPGERVELTVREADRSALRPESAFVDPSWVSIGEAAELAAYGLHRWHYRARPPRLMETVGFDRELPSVDRDHMHGHG
jgi:hypothetical protein